MRNKLHGILLKNQAAVARIPVEEEFYEQALKFLHICHMHKCKIITTGIGKAGIMAQLAAAKFCSIGAPAIYIHPCDALHGDLGIISPGDLLIIYSNSGKTTEVVKFLEYFNEFSQNWTILISSNGLPDSSMINCDVILETGNPDEAGVFGLLPSCSIVTMSIITDILVILLAEEIGFKKEHYATIHHAGYIGETLKKSDTK